MSAHQPRKGFIAQLEAFSRLQKCKENSEINKLSLHFCSSEGRNELDIKECVRLKKTLMTRRHTEDFQMRAWTHALKKSSRKRIFKAFRSPLCGFLNNNCQKAVVEDTLNKLISKVAGPRRNSNVILNSSYENTIKNNVINIHGTLYDTPILGVGDESQIKNKKILNSEDLADIIIKTNIVNGIGSLSYNTSSETIKNSSVICIFGSSLGKTDVFCWKEIITLMSWNQFVYLIIYWHTNNPPDNTSTSIIRGKNKIKRMFLDYADKPIIDMNEIMNRIFIVYNSKSMFNIKNTNDNMAFV